MSVSERLQITPVVTVDNGNKTELSIDTFNRIWLIGTPMSGVTNYTYLGEATSEEFDRLIDNFHNLRAKAIV